MEMTGSTTVLSAEAVTAYHRDGYVLAPGRLPAVAMTRLSAAVPAILDEDSARRIMERDGVTVRSVYGPHLADQTVASLSRLTELAGAAMDLIGEPVYVHQSKVNVKAPFVGDQWQWHQDYIYWLQDDGIREPNLVNAAVFLDEVNEFNGPLTFVPGSHDQGVLAAVEKEGLPIGYEDAPQWVSTLTADEKYGVRHDVIERLVRSRGLVSPKGPAGSVLFFHPNILHASSQNISPFGRRTLILVYNGVSNPATNTENPRPEFLAARDTTPIAVGE
ncbi:phytanoyl-CoA dioxygenase family protein [Actinocrispum wychmicini]|uniref:Ectoine hydroxylase n=1 Tax=Actinocrispum wychmicini TaxID=1213861 RepID=A0A4R2JS37_9PSEU|nr:phytanoyl-CoA dioxygenase family protein [Actinocrispum wychmicini]TCO61897.1 ectoine hydroxylase [Actinocrispum wychmicini]